MNIKSKSKLLLKNKPNSIHQLSQLGLVGIKNLGNSCYMNAAVQCLSNFYEFSNYFLKKDFDKKLIKEIKDKKGNSDINQYELLIKFTQIIKKIHLGKEKFISINSFRNSIGKKNTIFMSNTQEDTQEFLITLFDLLNEQIYLYNKKINKNFKTISTDLSKKLSLKDFRDNENNGLNELINYLNNNQSLISCLFTGQFRSTVQCGKCKNVSHNFEIFLGLSLPIPLYSEISFMVYFIFFNIEKGILQIPIFMESDLLILDLRNKLSYLLNIHPFSFIICLIKNNKVEKIYNNLVPISEIFYSGTLIDKIMLFCFEFDKNLFSNGDNKYFIIHSKMSSQVDGLSNSDIASMNNKNSKISYKKYHINDLFSEPQMTFYTQIDKTFLELYYGKDILTSKNNNSTNKNTNTASHFIHVPKVNSIFDKNIEDDYKEENRKNFIKLLTSSLYIYSDENYGFPNFYLKVLVNFSFFQSEFVNDYFSNYKRKEIGFQRFIYINIKWKLSFLEIYINNNFQINLITPQIRIVNINKNKFTKCVLCERIDCNNCPLNELKGYDTIMDLLQKYPKNDTLLIDNNYLYYDYNQRRLTYPKSDFELELVYPKSIYEKMKETLFNISKMIISTDNSNNLSKQKELEEKKNKNEIDIYDCIKKFSSREVLDEGNDWFCSNCKINQKAFKTMRINYAPNILMIQLKRFKTDGNIKIDNFIDFPIQNFILKVHHISESYDLMGIINHYGNISFGHYIAICKNYYNKKWYKFDDSSVIEINENEIVSKDAYVLFYKKNSFNLQLAEKWYDNMENYISFVSEKFKKFNFSFLEKEKNYK